MSQIFPSKIMLPNGMILGTDFLLAIRKQILILESDKPWVFLELVRVSRNPYHQVLPDAKEILMGMGLLNKNDSQNQANIQNLIQYLVKGDGMEIISFDEMLEKFVLAENGPDIE